MSKQAARDNRRKDFSTLTTRQVAKILNLCDRTVTSLMDSGSLAGAYRDIGSKAFGNRRIRREDLVAFMVKNGVPLSLLGRALPGWSVLCIGTDPSLQDYLLSREELRGCFDWRFADSLFEAGKEVMLQYPDVSIVDYLLGRESVNTLIPHLKKTPILAIYGEDGSDGIWDGYKGTFQKPVDYALLTEKLVSICKG